ncbi:MAG: cupin domain-containing protein [Nitrospinota bacterium]
MRGGEDPQEGRLRLRWDEPHGPYEYPDGCTVFVSFHGRSTAHVWEGGPGGVVAPAERKEGSAPPGARKEFVALYTREIPWCEEHPLLRVPPGARAKFLGADPATGRADVILQLPPGFLEARHSHAYYHSACVLEGAIEAAGKRLGADDYLFGWQGPHGPFTFPEGATLLVSYHGRDLPRMWESREEVAEGEKRFEVSACPSAVPARLPSPAGRAEESPTE